MSNKKESFKDFFYNIFDYIVMLAIILIVGLIIAWRLDILFMEEDESMFSKKEVKSETVESNNAKGKVKSLEDQIDKKNNKDKNSESNEKNKEEKEKKKTSIVAVEIPEGSSSEDIADILKNKKLIKENNEFISKVEEMEVSTKLRSGYFEVPEDASLEEVIKSITK